MSGNVGEHQTHHALSAVAPRKRPRQESVCDADSSLGGSEGSGQSGSGSSDNGENGDGRQVGSQKRARSEGHGDPEVSRDSIPWHRNVESRGTSNQLHAPIAVPSSSTRLPSGSNSGYLNSSEALRQPPPEEPFIPLPPVSSTPDVRREGSNYGDSRPVGHTTVREDIARSMAFDEQMDVLRHSPVSLPSSPIVSQLHSTEFPVEVHTALEPETSVSSEGTSPESTGELEASEPGSRARSSNSSGRLHALADTASMHPHILHAPSNRMVPTLPPILLPFPSQPASSTSGDQPPSLLPRLRILRRHEQSHVQPEPASRSTSQNLEPEQELDHRPMDTSPTEEAVRTPADAGLAEMSPTLPPSPVNGAQQSINPSAFPAGQNRYPFSRRDSLHDMHNHFDPFGLDETPFSELNQVEESAFPNFRVPAARRPRRQPSSPTTLGSIDRPFATHMDLAQNDPNDHSTLDNTTDEHLTGPGRGPTNASGPRGSAAGVTSWRHAGGDRLAGSVWAGIFDETDSERDGSPRRPTLLFDDSRRHAADSGRDLPFRHPRSVYDMFRDDLRRRSSVWDSPRRTSGQSESDHAPVSSSSSMSSYGRSTSRSLLDPTLSFGSGSAMNSRSSLSSASGQEQEQVNRPRLRSRMRMSSWVPNPRSLGDEDELIDSNLSAIGSERQRSESLAALSSFFSPMEAVGGENHSSLPASASRHVNNSRNTQTGAARLIPAHLPPVDLEPPFRAPLRSTYDVESPTSATHARSPGSWERDPATPDIPDLHPGRSVRRHFSPLLAARHLSTSSAPREFDRSYPSVHPFDLDEPPLPVASRFRLRRPVAQHLDLASDGPEAPADPMEDVIPESNARETDSASASFRRRPSSPFASGRQSFPRIEPPPRPMEPRLSSWDVGPRQVHATSSRPRSPSPPFIPRLLRQGHDSPDVADAISNPIIRPQRTLGVSYRAMFDRPVPAGLNEQPLSQQRSTSNIDGDERRPSHVATNPTRFDSRPEPGPSNQSSEWLPASPARRGTVSPRVETFNELLHRRAMQARLGANRRPPSPEPVFRPTYRLPRPSFLHDDEDPTTRRERMSRRSNPAFSNRTSTADGGSIMEDSRQDRLERQRAALLLERSISSRYPFGSRPFNRHEWDIYYDNLMPTTPLDRPQSDDQEERNGNEGSGVRTRMLERSARQALLSTSVDAFGVENAEESDGARERQELHDAIGRRSRDDELSTRRSLPNTDRARHITPRDPMSLESTRNLQRRLRESEAEVGRALRALDQWGELEGSGERDSDPTQSRMHRYGETLRRRRVPPAFSFSDRVMDQDPSPGSGSSNTARPGRRSPSPPTAAARLQSRQARFARAQGRFREMGTDIFGEPRSRGAYASRLDMLGGGSRFSSRYVTRNLGDYMRDEDFDASYENLVRLAASVGEAKPRGTPAHLLAAMPTGFYKDFAAPGCDSRCPICLDDYKDLDPVLRISDCEHWFHKECLEQWLSGENSCPICRRRIRGRAQQEPPDDAPGPSGSRRDDGSDDDAPGSGSGGPGRTGSPGLTLEELSSYAAGW